jgi:alpha-galactosidase
MKGTHVFIINTSGAKVTKKFKFSNVPGLGTGSYKVHNMWKGKDLVGTYNGTFSVGVAAHDTLALLITPA